MTRVLTGQQVLVLKKTELKQVGMRSEADLRVIGEDPYQLRRRRRRRS